MVETRFEKSEYSMSRSIETIETSLWPGGVHKYNRQASDQLQYVGLHRSSQGSSLYNQTRRPRDLSFCPLETRG